MSTNDVYYKLSGRYHPAAAAAGLAIAVVVGVVGGAIYGVIDRYNPIIYLNILALIGMGIGLAVSMSYLARLMHIRNSYQLIITALIGALAAEYGATVSWVLAISNWEILVINPSSLISVLEFIAKDGVWSIGRGSNHPVSGIALYTVWVGEAAILLVCTVTYTHARSKEAIYCEACKDWADGREIFQKFQPIANTGNFVNSLEQGDFEPLFALPRVPANLPAWSSIELQRCEKCHELCLLHVRNHVVTEDKNGNPVESKTDVIHNRQISAEIYALLKQDFSAERFAATANPRVVAAKSS